MWVAAHGTSFLLSFKTWPVPGPISGSRLLISFCVYFSSRFQAPPPIWHPRALFISPSPEPVRRNGAFPRQREAGRTLRAGPPAPRPSPPVGSGAGRKAQAQRWSRGTNGQINGLHLGQHRNSLFCFPLKNVAELKNGGRVPRLPLQFSTRCPYILRQEF